MNLHAFVPFACARLHPKREIALSAPRAVWSRMIPHVSPKLGWNTCVLLCRSARRAHTFACLACNVVSVECCRRVVYICVRNKRVPSASASAVCVSVLFSCFTMRCRPLRALVPPLPAMWTSCIVFRERAIVSSGPRNRIRMTLNTYPKVAPLPARIGR